MTNLAEVRQVLITQTSKKFVDTLYKKPWSGELYNALAAATGFTSGLTTPQA